MRWNFAKYAGCGNDFIFFDNRNGQFPWQHTALIQSLCHRQFGVGADGLILAESSACADLRMRIFNADGSEAEMCGNGLRCFVKFAQELGLHQAQYTIETMRRPLKASYQGSLISVEMGVPFDMQWKIALSEIPHEIHFLNTGVPHAIFFTEDIKAIHLAKLGPRIRYHERFAPTGTNVNAVQILSDEALEIRTYERGVEQETLACGTGATAAALAAAYIKQLRSPIKVLTQSKEFLEISFCLHEGKFSDVKMAGTAQYIFKGEIDL